jgi:predicted transcriptional regulator
MEKTKSHKWITIYIGKGKKDKLSKTDILGFLCQKGGLTKDEVGRIDVKEHQSFVAVSRQRHRELLERISGEKIKGLKTIIQVTR